jgi:hypothetical protein
MKIVGGDYFVHCVTIRTEKKDSKSEVVVCGGEAFSPEGTRRDTLRHAPLASASLLQPPRLLSEHD